ncbi:MAG TPA: hypothetical protein PLN30_11930, partial [Ferruginibacter sp.]|nr:hypothetical protein [Ferruginibacter sp.]
PAALKGYEQFYPLLSDSLLTATLKVNNAEAVYGKDFITPVSRNSTAVFNASEIVFMGYGIDDEKYSDYNGADLKGKVALFLLGEPKDAEGNYVISGTKRISAWTFPGLSKKLAIAASKGAVGAWVISPMGKGFSERTIARSKKENPYYAGNNRAVALNFAEISPDFAAQL